MSTVATLIHRARNNDRITDYWGRQLPEHGFPFGDHDEVASWLNVNGFTHLQDSGDGWITQCGVRVTDHGVVRRLNTSNL